MLAAICCHYNPCGFRRPRENYHRFRAAFRGCPLFTVEASFDGEFHLPADWRIAATSRNLLWQKEALLNWAISRLPDEFDQVAWIDADFLFLNPDWAAQTAALLQELPVVQLFEHVHDLDAGGRVTRVLPSVALQRREGNAGFGRPGGAWAARRELLARHGLYEREVLGGGDCRWADACLGVFDGHITTLATPALNAHAAAWTAGVWGDVLGRVGCVPGDLVHLRHGSVENRQYVSRAEILRDEAFDPVRDVRSAETGLLQWASRKPTLHGRVAEYFLGRREDE
jgi:hypothetical protein